MHLALVSVHPVSLHSYSGAAASTPAEDASTQWHGSSLVIPRGCRTAARPSHSPSLFEHPSSSQSVPQLTHHCTFGTLLAYPFHGPMPSPRLQVRARTIHHPHSVRCGTPRPPPRSIEDRGSPLRRVWWVDPTDLLAEYKPACRKPACRKSRHPHAARATPSLKRTTLLGFGRDHGRHEPQWAAGSTRVWDVGGRTRRPQLGA